MSSIDFTGKRPKLLVFAGPNGSGKSTVTKGLPVVGLYVNADEIKRSVGCSDLSAAREAEQIRETLLFRRQDFTFETVLSTDRNLELLRRAKEAGYKIFAVFVLTHDPEINVKRVAERVQSGGHHVPEDKIRSRYKKSINNLPKLIHIADVTRIIDNSEDEPNLICEIRGKSIQIWNNDVWSKTDILRLIT